MKMWFLIGFTSLLWGVIFMGIWYNDKDNELKLVEQQQNQHCLDYYGARFGRVYAEEKCN